MIAIVARGACSALGFGDEALGVMRPGEAPTVRVTRDHELVTAGLSKPYAGRVPIQTEDDRATALLGHALASCMRELDDAVPGWRSLRVGSAIGTSSGGMRSFEKYLEGGAASSAATYIGPVIDVARPVPLEPTAFVLGACASSTLAIGLARTWLLADRCDVALCGGFDAVSVFVAAGFESLRATCGPLGPRPFRQGRDGLALGEGAAILALVRADHARRTHAWISGFGATCDATHLTAPDRTGSGLERAARAALEEAGRSSVDLISAHGTATQQNDAAEAAAIAATLDRSVPVHSLKGAVGHTLGAAGALEVLSAAAALRAGVAPATAGEGPVEAGLRIVDRGEPLHGSTALKLSSAFGGANAALVIEREPPPTRAARAQHPVFVSRAVAVTLDDIAELSTRIAYGADRIARADDLVRLALAATAELERACGELRGAGIIVGQGLATIETNARFQARIRSAGAARAEPRRFPYTTPNAAAGECAVAFGLTGPAFAVGGGPHGGIEALATAADLVRAGVVDRIVVVAADEAGEATARFAPATKSGAVALLVSRTEGACRLTSWTVRFEAQPAPGSANGADDWAAHPALLPLVRGRPDAVSAAIPWGGLAKATFDYLEFA